MQVVPLTSNVTRLYPGEGYVTLDGKQHKALADQITTAARQRLQSRIAVLTADDLRAVARAIQVQLALSA